MTRTIHLDATSPLLTKNERRIVDMRNRDMSWSEIITETRLARSTCKGAWDNACRKLHGTPPPQPAARHEDSTIGNEQTMRGIPITGRGVGGTMRGTRPDQEVA